MFWARTVVVCVANCRRVGDSVVSTNKSEPLVATVVSAWEPPGAVGLSRGLKLIPPRSCVATAEAVAKFVVTFEIAVAMFA